MDLKYYLKSLKNKIKPAEPTFTQAWFPAKPGLEKGRTLLIVVGNNFNQELMRASTFLPLGYASGWAEACGPVKLVSEKNILKEINNFEKPIVFASIYNLKNWSLKKIKKLKNVDTFIIVNVHPKKYKSFVKENPLIGHGDPFAKGGYDEAYNKLLALEPNFIFSIAGKAAGKWYTDWEKDGFHFEYIMLAADQHIYYPDPAPEKYGNIKMAYVGGYWGEKAQAFDKYLRPHEDILIPYGYAKWPYKNYGGRLSIEEERQLYSSAGLIPLITSPAGWSMAEVTERYFKAPACKAFCIADENPGLADVFDPDEILQVKNAEHFHSLVNDYLHGKIDINYWREKTHKAIMDRHLYRHRAMQIKNALEKK